LFTPRIIDSIIVGLGLLIFSLFYLFKSKILVLPIPEWLILLGNWLIPIIFLLRAVGEFKYIGFFKKIKKTTFAHWDDRLFSPLCLLIAACGFAALILEP
jgi:hypothetical protein